MIHFTKHAVEKFRILKEHGVKISRKDVIHAIQKPEMLDYSRLPLKIAQCDLDKAHVLRVVYKEEDGNQIIITFYPGRRTQYAYEEKND